jgi:hypothetical protein
MPVSITTIWSMVLHLLQPIEDLPSSIVESQKTLRMNVD